MIAIPDGATTVTDMILAEELRLRRMARRLVRCESDADDLVQDTLLRAFRARDRFEPGTSVRAWTTTILRRVFLTGVNRGRRRGLANDTDAGAPLDRAAGVAAPTAEDERPALASLFERLDDRVKTALERVPELYRTPFLLSVLDEMSCAEIAARLGVPEGTVMSRIHRAREKLKADLVYGPCVAAALPTARLRVLGGRAAPRLRLVAV
jgi:RNA polymerase sigma-70 factor (ECF subfamily)